MYDGIRDPRWFVSRILSGKEKIIEFYMKREGIEVLFPMADNKRIYPGYAFMRFDRDLDWWYGINNTHGVIHLLPIKNEQPICLPRGFVEKMKEQIEAGVFSSKAAQELAMSYLPGDMVEVLVGTHAGLDGELVRYTKSSLILLMAMFNTRVQVSVPRGDVSPRVA